MIRAKQQDHTLDATAVGVMVVTGLAVAVIVYALALLVHLVPASAVTQNVGRFGF